ncbi:sugar phosphate isomerase/epimerase family protein [Actinophytocola sp.]|uniref:sugar phosphate isomerase/epimerase family protein n=1 Tax=Actinophytocola sp. TaxID=1872138 RepID=UPI002D7FAABE|nr:sugar phosphate isomerase/epimerase family protein [Actinophytocola sp.]HET9142637.1 sugar phosphate isomerase/epimerase family protein [Actinophytocola sp.]
MARFSFNQATANNWALAELVDGCAAAGVGSVGLWRAPVLDHGLARAAKRVRDAGLSVSSLCRGGFFTAADWLDDNRRAIDEAATLGAPVLVLVVGGLGGRALDDARAHVATALDTLVPHARAAGVRLAVEPMHPMYCADRGVVSTLAAALDLAARYPSRDVGVVIDTYHVWWDEKVWSLIAEAGAADRIAGYQVADWVTPLPEGVLLGRALPGAGHIEIPRYTQAVTAAGYTGPIEVEVFNADLWTRPGPDILADTIAAYLSHVVPNE